MQVRVTFPKPPLEVRVELHRYSPIYDVRDVFGPLVLDLREPDAKDLLFRGYYSDKGWVDVVPKSVEVLQDAPPAC